MVADGLLVPVGRMLVVMNPTSVPSVDSLEQFGLQNTLSIYEHIVAADAFRRILFTTRKRIIGRDVVTIWTSNLTRVAAFRGGDSTTSVGDSARQRGADVGGGSESLFAHDYVFEFPTKPLPPYLNKKRQFKITNNTGMQLLPLMRGIT